MTLDRLNVVSQAWVEMEYNRKIHSATNRSPLDRYLHDKDVGRPCPTTDILTEVFTAEYTRKQRRSDGTLSLLGTRYEVPSRMGHLEKLSVRCASWDLSRAWISDPKTGKLLCRIYPQDKVKNAEGDRARRGGSGESKPEQSSSASVVEQPSESPLLEKILQEYHATGMPPAYQPGPDTAQDNDDDPSAEINQNN